MFAGEARTLTEQLALAQDGKAFVLIAGDCAESFAAFSADSIRDKLRVILQMSVVLAYGGGVPTVKIARMAGQFAKPRSSDTEERDKVVLPSFRGDAVNDFAFTADARVADPQRMIKAYNQSAATLNLMRALSKGGFAALGRVHAWTQESIAASAEGRRYDALANEIERALRFMSACGIDPDLELALREVDVWTAHESLLLDYEEALTRRDSISGDWYDCSAHLLWIGERTRHLNGAHVNFLSGVKNPIGIKLGPTTTPEEVSALCERLNPARQPGRIMLCSRMGANEVSKTLPPLLRATAGLPVTWACDPMHGNTYEAPSGYKTRKFDDVIDEVKGFFEVHKKLGTHPGGIHIELTGDDVTECVGGGEAISHEDLSSRYESACDPRLNHTQSLELAFLVAEMLRDRRK